MTDEEVDIQAVNCYLSIRLEMEGRWMNLPSNKTRAITAKPQIRLPTLPVFGSKQNYKSMLKIPLSMPSNRGSLWAKICLPKTDA